MKKFDVVSAVIAVFFVLGVVFLFKAVADCKKDVQEEPTVYIVYTDEESKPYAVVTNPNLAPSIPLTEYEREQIASIVSGKSGNKPVSVQLMVANVIRNEIMYCHGDIDEAVKSFQLSDYREPTEDSYEVVDAVFDRAELSLDDDVLYFNSGHSDFHETLTFVCEYFGISFYKEG